MVKNFISLILVIVSASLSFKHAWDTAHYKDRPESVKIMKSLGISESLIPYIVFVSLAAGMLLLIPRTFFMANMLNAFLIVLLMGMELRTGNYRMAFIEIPFLAMPLIMIWLKYPFKN